MSEIMFKAGNKVIGDHHPCFIIAEAGVNHNGSIELAKKLIDVAAAAGVDAVKFQVLTAKGLYVQDAGRVVTDTGDDIDIYKVWEKVEMPASWIPELKKYCEQKKVLFFSSAFDEHSVEMLDPYVELYKIASSELTHIPLLKKVARTGKPIIISLGGAKLEEIEEAVKAIFEEGNTSVVLLHCVLKYPTPLHLANVSAVRTIKEKFPSVLVGYSDHSLEPADVPAAAVALGANVIEKHFTLSRAMQGIDHKMSLQPDELWEMVQGIREMEQKINGAIKIDISPELVGNGDFYIAEDTQKIRSFVRRTIFAMKPIQKGEKFTSDNIAVLRPGNRNTTNALHPREYFQVIGQQATENIQALSVITQEIMEKINYLEK